MSPAFIRQLEIEMQRQALISLLVLLVLFALGTWITYLVLRAAIRDGIRESGLVQTWRTTAAASRQQQPTDLPDMRAER